MYIDLIFEAYLYYVFKFKHINCLLAFEKIDRNLCLFQAKSYLYYFNNECDRLQLSYASRQSEPYQTRLYSQQYIENYIY